jgi:uncharacterized protein (TIGR02284 family)
MPGFRKWIIKAFFMKIIHKLHQYTPEKVGKRNRRAIQVLKDLIRINKDRITGYEKAAHEDNKRNPGIRSILYRMATESRAYVNELHVQVIRLGGAPVTKETITGNIYLFWLDLKADFGCADTPPGLEVRGPEDSKASATLQTRPPGRRDDAALLEACAYAEEALQKAYEKALETGEDLPKDIFHLIERQLWALQFHYPTFIRNAGNISGDSI